MYFQEFVRIVTSNTVLIKRDLVSTKVKMVLSHQMLCHFIAGGQNAFVGVINTSTFKGRKNSLAVSAHVIVHLLFTSEAANLKDVTVIISEVKRL